MDQAAFFATSATAKSFLDFPTEVRNRIYRLAIADHDRSAVYLPRLAPRKVTPKEDLDMKYGSIWEEEGEAPTEYYFYPGEEGCSLASGDWKFGKADSPVVDNDEGADRSLTEVNADDEEFWNEKVRNIDDGGRELDDAATEDLCGGEHEDYPCLCSCHDALFVGQERSNTALDCSGASDEEPCYCICHDRAPADKEGELVVGQCEPPVLRDRHAPDACLRNECRDDECQHCEGMGLAHKDQKKGEKEIEEEHDLSLAQDDEIEDDMEHYDSEELIGMIYEPKEPSILLACKQVRDECLAVYYSQNSFSWRFLWLDYRRSLNRFNHWAQDLRDHDAKLITQLTLEGRHTVEEGINFDVDIDLIPTSPYFSITSNTFHGPDYSLGFLKRGLEKDLVWRLWDASSGATQRFVFTPSLIADLGAIFVKTMER